MTVLPGARCVRPDGDVWVRLGLRQPQARVLAQLPHRAASAYTGTRSGPTLFAPLLDRAIGYANSSMSQPGQHYFVLLILTDGVINVCGRGAAIVIATRRVTRAFRQDMDATVERLVTASTLPLSIIIVGVGDADFSAMEYLDAGALAYPRGCARRLTYLRGDCAADGTLLAHRGRRAARDIVQFVPFRCVGVPAGSFRRMGSAHGLVTPWRFCAASFCMHTPRSWLSACWRRSRSS